MRIDELKRALGTRPFRPFSVRMADGWEFPVSHPEAVAWALNETRSAICILPDGVREVFDVALVTSLGIPAPTPDRP